MTSTQEPASTKRSDLMLGNLDPEWNRMTVSLLGRDVSRTYNLDSILVDGFIAGNLGPLRHCEGGKCIYMEVQTTPENQPLLEHLERLVNRGHKKTSPPYSYSAHTYQQNDRDWGEGPNLMVETWDSRDDEHSLVNKILDYLVGKHRLTLAHTVTTTDAIALYEPIIGGKRGSRVSKTILDPDRDRVQLRGCHWRLGDRR